MLLFALAVAPGLAISIYIFWKDKFEKEPKRLLLFSFVLGVLSVIPAIVLEIFSDAAFVNRGNNIVQTALYAWLGIGLIEEGCKYFFIRLFAYRSKSFNEPFDGITYSVMVAMGFATIENVMYVIDGGYGVGILRMFTAVPAHATFGVMMGYYLGLEKVEGKKHFGIIGLLVATTFHAAYDFFLIADYVPGMWIGAWLSLYFGIRFSFRAIKLHQQLSPFQRSETGE